MTDSGPPVPVSPRFACHRDRRAPRLHSIDRVLPHAREVDQGDPTAGDRKRLQRDIVVEAVLPDLNRTAAAVLLRILLEAADRVEVVREGDDRSVQS